MRTLVLIAVVTCTLAGQSSRTPPRVTSKTEPEYSEEARKARLEGTVILMIVVGADGNPRDLKVLRGLGLGLDEKAKEAVTKWHFAPGTNSGEPVDIKAQVQVDFRLMDKIPWRLERAGCFLAGGLQGAITDKVVDPPVTERATSATATLTFNIDEKGAPANIRIIKASDEEWARDATDALGKWKYIPVSKGSQLSVSCTLDFVRGGYIP